MRFSAARWIPWTLILAWVVSACASATPLPATSPPPTQTPKSTEPPAPTPTPAADAPQATNLPGLTAYEHNPVLTEGEPGSWDSGLVFNARVVYDGRLYHLFYNGADRDTGEVAIGYAKSSDGRAYTREALKPVLEGDEQGFDAIQVSDAVPMVESDTWILYYNAGAGPGPGKAIGRATAPDPSGLWARRMEPVLRTGPQGSWDSGFVTPQSVVRDGEVYVMYYAGGAGQSDAPSMIGRATSADGIAWTKHDDPSTAEPPFAQSDPVLQAAPTESWESKSIWGCSVLHDRSGWEMFYAASGGEAVRLGYATSIDGVQWDRHDGNPILSPTDDPARPAPEARILESPAALVTDLTYLLYYDYGLRGGGIGLATGSARRE